MDISYCHLLFDKGTKSNAIIKVNSFQQMAPELDIHMEKYKTNPKLI